jgi:hypothetical protein
LMGAGCPHASKKTFYVKSHKRERKKPGERE